MPHRRPFLAAAVAAVAACSLLAAGCGGSGGAGVASITSSTTATTSTASQRGLLAFAQCMRSHGMPNFPDPQQGPGGNVKLVLHRVGTSKRQMNASLSACHRLLPTGGGPPPQTPRQLRTQLADGLSFARCMRSHGVSRFPDPTPQGQLSVEMVQQHGVDVRSPAVLHVVQECLPASHGALTPAKVREALRDAGD
jgi:hypothetical protein